jgi:hypothetical protein
MLYAQFNIPLDFMIMLNTQTLFICFSRTMPLTHAFFIKQ